MSTVTEWASNLDLVAVRERSLALGANKEPVPGEGLGTCVCALYARSGGRP